MDFIKRLTVAEGRNKFGKYLDYRKRPENACENGEWVLQSVDIAYSSGTSLNPNQSNYATVNATLAMIIDEDYTAQTKTVAIQPEYSSRPDHYYKIVRNRIYWNDSDYGTTVTAGGRASLNYTYSGTTGSLYVNYMANQIVGAESEITSFNDGQSTINIGSGETSLFFTATASRRNLYTSGQLGSAETISTIENEGDGYLFLESDIGYPMENSLDIPTNYSASEVRGYVRVVDDLDRSATAEITIIQEAAVVPATISPVSLSYTSNGGSETLTVTDASNVGWSIAGAPSWLTLSSTQGTGTTTVTAVASANTGTSQRTGQFNFSSNGSTTAISLAQEGVAPLWNCYLNFDFGSVTAPQTATWDEYMIYYDTTGGNPVEDGSLMMSISCGTIIYQGNTWNPTSSSYYSVSSPFGDAGSVSQIEVPQSLAGQTIYLKVEFGSAEAGQAVYSALVTVQIPSSGGTVNVTIPAF